LPCNSPRFLTLMAEIEDPRRAEGKLYRLPHVVLFAILAMVAGANSYRSIHSFIDVHFVRLRKFFRLKWRAPFELDQIKLFSRDVFSKSTRHDSNEYI
jgi:hypothetical protein